MMILANDGYDAIGQRSAGWLRGGVLSDERRLLDDAEKNQDSANGGSDDLHQFIRSKNGVTSPRPQLLPLQMPQERVLGAGTRSIRETNFRMTCWTGER